MAAAEGRWGPVLPDDLGRRLERCTSCAACRSGCPTFDVTGLEGHGGRGRVLLARGLTAGELGADARVADYLRACTRCGWCETVCPVAVPVVGLVEEARARVDGGLGGHRLTQRLLGLLPERGRLDRALRHVVRRGGPALGRLPATAGEGPAAGGTIDLFVGCRANHLAPDVVGRAVDLLRAAGHAVRVPPEQTCSGYLSQAVGRRDLTARLQRRNAAALSSAARVATLCAGCRSHLAPGAPVADVVELLLEKLEPDAARAEALAAPVAVHVPCQDRWHGRAVPDLAGFLARAGVELRDVPAPACCGGAAPSVWEAPDVAADLARPWLAALREAGVRTLVTGDPGCLEHLGKVGGAHGGPSVLHAVEAVDLVAAR